MAGHDSSQPLIVKAACESGAGRKPDASTFEASFQWRILNKGTGELYDYFT